MSIYGVKSKAEILTSILRNLEKNAGITATYPGSIAQAFADAFSSEISDLYEAFRFSVNQSRLTTASGRNLDLIGDLYGIPRKSVSDYVAQERQTYNIEFFINKQHSRDVIIPRGTLVYNDVSNFTTKQYSYAVAGDVIIPTGSLKAYGIVKPNFSDNSYVAGINTLTKHNYIGPNTVIVGCSNPKEVYSNISSESDDNYRRRILASMKTRLPGTAESVRFAALSVKGVRDVRIRQATYGIGSCDVIVVPEVSSGLKALPESILTAITSVKPVGIRFNVRIAEKVIINVNYTITVPTGNSESGLQGLLNQSTLFVKRYLNSLSIGDTVSLSELERQIKLSSDIIRGVTFSGLTANGKDLPLKDIITNSVTEYYAAGNVVGAAVVVGAAAY